MKYLVALELRKTAEEIPTAPVVTSYTELKKHLKPGDIFVSSMAAGEKVENNPLKILGEKTFRILSHALQGDYTHSGLYAGRGKVLEIRAGGPLQVVDLKKALRTLDAKIVRPRIDAEIRRQAVERMQAIAEKGVKYDYGLLPRVVAAEVLGLKGDARDLNKRIKEQKVICSNIIAHAYKGVNFKPGKHRSLLLPKDFLESSKAEHVVTFKNPGRYDPERREKVSAIPRPVFAAFAKSVEEMLGKDKTDETEALLSDPNRVSSPMHNAPRLDYAKHESKARVV